MAFNKRISAWWRKLNRPFFDIQQALADQTAIQRHDVQVLRDEMTSVHSLLVDRISSALLPQSLPLMTAGLSARAQRLVREGGLATPGAAVARDIPFEKSLAFLEQLNPRLFPIWLRLFENGAKSYVEERFGSCSHREHFYAKLFGAYIEIYGQGRILDVGCGPYSVPSYLASHRSDLIYGVEPLETLVEPGFRVARGFNEFLPWEDAQFDTVVSGTSLDHVLSLEKSLAEVCRVLRPNGKYLVWLASVPGSAPFDETAEEFHAIDKFHLFHFDRSWIEPLFERHFQIEDVTITEQPGFDHAFYCLSPRPPS